MFKVKNRTISVRLFCLYCKGMKICFIQPTSQWLYYFSVTSAIESTWTNKFPIKLYFQHQVVWPVFFYEPFFGHWLYTITILRLRWDYSVKLSIIKFLSLAWSIGIFISTKNLIRFSDFRHVYSLKNINWL